MSKCWLVSIQYWGGCKENLIRALSFFFPLWAISWGSSTQSCHASATLKITPLHTLRAPLPLPKLLSTGSSPAAQTTIPSVQRIGPVQSRLSFAASFKAHVSPLASVPANGRQLPSPSHHLRTTTTTTSSPQPTDNNAAASALPYSSPIGSSGPRDSTAFSGTWEHQPLQPRSPRIAKSGSPLGHHRVEYCEPSSTVSPHKRDSLIASRVSE
jgi:hypothetical protein